MSRIACIIVMCRFMFIENQGPGSMVQSLKQAALGKISGIEMQLYFATKEYFNMKIQFYANECPTLYCFKFLGIHIQHMLQLATNDSINVFYQVRNTGSFLLLVIYTYSRWKTNLGACYDKHKYFYCQSSFEFFFF